MLLQIRQQLTSLTTISWCSKTMYIMYLPLQPLPPLCGGGSDTSRWHAQTLSHSSSFPWPAALGSPCVCSQRQNGRHTPGGAEGTWRILSVPQDEEESRKNINLIMCRLGLQKNRFSIVGLCVYSLSLPFSHSLSPSPSLYLILSLPLSLHLPIPLSLSHTNTPYLAKVSRGRLHIRITCGWEIIARFINYWVT